MPIVYQIDSPNCFIHTRCVGNIALQDARDHLLALQADPICPASLNVLLDLTETVTVPDSDDLRIISDEIGRVQGIRFNACAIYTVDDHLYGMARMFVVFARNRFQAMHVFRTLDNARRWLDSFQISAGPAPLDG
ncbi:MAG TPA: hypothetical protein VG733_12615 [Chthoniobacteraceae bacterium]|nr:hypothetical protein [Chthoniobacteraceae bacterium]